MAAIILLIRRLAWAAVALLAVAVAVAWLLRPVPPIAASPMVGQSVPSFDLPGLDAAHPGLAASDLRQGSVTVVNLFASWCLPCRLEAPQLRALADKGATIHGIAVADRPLDAQAFLAKVGNPYRRIGLDPDRIASQAWRSSGVPETYVVDGQGVVIAQRSGPLRPEDVADLLNAARTATP